MIKIFEDYMAIFSFRQHQDFLTYFKRLKDFGLTFIDVENYLFEKKILLNKQNEKIKQSQFQFRRNKIVLKCSKCNTPMNLFPVNTNRQNQTGDKSKSQWFCPKCWYEIYSEKTTADWMKELNKQGSEND